MAARPSAAVRARRRRDEVLLFIAEHPPAVRRSGFVEFAPAGRERSLAVVCFTGRGGTPADRLCGMHQMAAWAARSGARALVASAHDDARRRALDWLLRGGARERVVVLGHSHGGDHASELAANFLAKAGRPVETLVTIDPMNSPFPFPLRRPRDAAAARRHLNYYQRNAPWFGGSLPEADANEDVSDPVRHPSWSALFADPERRRAAISHASIDEDLFLAGVLPEAGLGGA